MRSNVSDADRPLIGFIVLLLQFLTINCGDEKSHLVPVLNTILKLSPDETQKLERAARGLFSYLLLVLDDLLFILLFIYCSVGEGQRNWGSYLPGWSSNQ